MTSRRSFITTCLLVTLALVAGGCASQQKQSSDMDLQLRKQSEIYHTRVQPLDFTEVSGNCDRMYTSLQKNWEWHEAMNTGNACLKSHELSDVEEVGNDLSTRTPAAPWGPFYLGQVALARGEWDRAYWMAELALNRSPSVAVLHYFEGQVLWQKLDYRRAVMSFKTALKINPQMTAAHLFLAQVLERAEKFSEAFVHYKTVLQDRSKDEVALQGYANCALKADKPNDALWAYQRLSALEPNQTIYMGRIADIYENNLNDAADALVVLERLREKKNVDVASLDAHIKMLKAEMDKLSRKTASQTSQASQPSEGGSAQ